jgi:hypothetical protein
VDPPSNLQPHRVIKRWMFVVGVGEDEDEMSVRVEDACAVRAALVRRRSVGGLSVVCR